MRITMYMALDALAGFMPEPEIVDGETPLSGPRLTEGAGLISLRAEDGGVLVSGGRDRIRVRGRTLSEVHDALMAAEARWDDWEKRLESAAAEQGLQELVEIAYSLFDEPIFITDARDRICAITRHARGAVNDEWDYILSHGCMPPGRLVDIYRDPQFRRAGNREGEPFIFNPPGMSHRGVNMRFQDADSGDWLGVGVIIEHKAALTKGKLHLARCFYEAVKLNLKLHPASRAAEAESAQLSDLLCGRLSPERATLLGVRLFSGAERLLVAVLEPAAARPPQHAAPMLERAFAGARCLLEERELYAILPYSADAAQRLDAVAAQAEARIGLSRPFSDWARVAEYRDQARMALDTGGGRVNELTSRSVNALCAKTLSEHLSGATLAHPALAVLADYDAKHHTALYGTLKTYLAQERNLIRTAEALYIHRNSLVYRIRRIAELTGLRLDEPEERRYLMYSFDMLLG